MADRYPLVVASGVVQELAFADNLNLSGSGITNTTSITCDHILLQSGAISIAGSTATDGVPGANNIAIGRSASELVGIMTGMNTIAIGYTDQFPAVGGHDNIILGPEAGVSLTGPNTHSGALNITAEYNFLAIRGAGSRISTGSRNVAIGLGAGAGIQTGNHNYCVGEDTMSLPSYLTCDGNISIGDQTGRNLTGGSNNVLIGRNAGRAANGIGNSFTASQNVMIGVNAGYVNTVGDSNVYLGGNAGSAGTEASYGVACGKAALYALTTGMSNTGIGASAGDNITTGSNNTCIGRGSQVSVATTSNQIVLGDSSVTNLRCNVTTISAVSDERDKTNIVDLPIGLEFVNSLRPVKFDWNRRDGSMVGLKEAGFIAQELDAAQGAAGAEDYLRLVLKDNPEQLEAAPGKLIPVLVKAIQELSARVAELEAK